MRRLLVCCLLRKKWHLEKALLIKYFLLARSTFSYPVFCLDYHGLHLASLVLLTHQNLVQQLVDLVTIKSFSVNLVLTMILQAYFSTQVTMQSKTYLVKTPTLNSNTHQLSYFSSPASSSVSLVMELLILLVSLFP